MAIRSRLQSPPQAVSPRRIVTRSCAPSTTFIRSTISHATSATARALITRRSASTGHVPSIAGAFAASFPARSLSSKLAGRRFLSPLTRNRAREHWPVLHIAIDAHSVGAGLAGNESYITNLIESLAEIDAANRYTLYVTRREAVERFEGRWPHVSIRLTLPHTPLLRIPLTLSAELRRRPVDLLHVQYTAPPLAPCPVVATIHDLSFEHLPETFKRRSRTQLRLTVRRTARMASAVIAPSEFSRRDLIETYQLPPERVKRTPLAAAPHCAPVTDEAERRRVKELYRITGEYILAVGAIQPRKNLVRLVEAYADLRRRRPQAKLPQLVLVGKRGWLYGEALSAARRHTRDGDIHFAGYVREGDLPALYTDATAFVYPSYFEGFGLPLLEAMACGAPEKRKAEQ